MPNDQGRFGKIEQAPSDPTYEKNRRYARPGPYVTQLSPQEETGFQQWVKDKKIPFDPSPTSDYDMRGFYRGMKTGDKRASTGTNANDGQLHFSDAWKTPYHKSFSAESQYATPDAPSWNDKDQLVDKQGRVVFDERAEVKAPQGRFGAIKGADHAAIEADQPRDVRTDERGLSAPRRSDTPLDTAADAAVGAGSALFRGGDDEIVGVVHAIGKYLGLSSTGYTEARDAYRDRKALAEDRSPLANTGAQMAEAVAETPLLIAKAPGALAKVAGFGMGEGAAILGKAGARYVAEGVLSGVGGQESARGEIAGAGDLAKAAGTGAAVGTVTGGLFHAGGRMIANRLNGVGAEAAQRASTRAKVAQANMRPDTAPGGADRMAGALRKYKIGEGLSGPEEMESQAINAHAGIEAEREKIAQDLHARGVTVPGESIAQRLEALKANYPDELQGGPAVRRALDAKAATFRRKPVPGALPDLPPPPEETQVKDSFDKFARQFKIKRQVLKPNEAPPQEGAVRFGDYDKATVDESVPRDELPKSYAAPSPFPEMVDELPKSYAPNDAERALDFARRNKRAPFGQTRDFPQTERAAGDPVTVRSEPKAPQLPEVPKPVTEYAPQWDESRYEGAKNKAWEDAQTAHDRATESAQKERARVSFSNARGRTLSFGEANRLRGLAGNGKNLDAKSEIVNKHVHRAINQAMESAANAHDPGVGSRFVELGQDQAHVSNALEHIQAGLGGAAKANAPSAGGLVAGAAGGLVGGPKGALLSAAGNSVLKQKNHAIRAMLHEGSARVHGAILPYTRTIGKALTAYVPPAALGAAKTTAQKVQEAEGEYGDEAAAQAHFVGSLTDPEYRKSYVEQK